MWSYGKGWATFWTLFLFDNLSLRGIGAMGKSQLGC